MTKDIEDAKIVCHSMIKFLDYKNGHYGNSVNEPIGVFSKGDAKDLTLVRTDDKLKRIQNSDVLRKNDVVDLIGYLVWICVQNGWTSFDDLMD